MKNILCILFLSCSALFASDIETSTYQVHLPDPVYFSCTKQLPIDEDCLENNFEKVYLEGIETLNISICESSIGEYVLVDYVPRVKEDGFGGIQIGYQDQKMVAYVIFDEEGLDYVSPPPFSDKEESKAIISILGYIFPNFT